MAALYERAMAALPPPDAGGTARRPWQHAWMDSLQAMAWLRTGEVDRAAALVARSLRWLADGTLLGEEPAALDEELQANIAIAAAHVAAAHGDTAEARQQARRARASDWRPCAPFATPPTRWSRCAPGSC
jgi:hypothetical protein